MIAANKNSNSLFPCFRQSTLCLIITRQTMNARLDQNQTIFGINILVEICYKTSDMTNLAIAFKMLANTDGLLDQIIQIFRNFGRQTFRFQNTQDLVAGQPTYLCNAVTVAQDDT